jgi:hypothetical protein
MTDVALFTRRLSKSRDPKPEKKKLVVVRIDPSDKEFVESVEAIPTLPDTTFSVYSRFQHMYGAFFDMV